MHPIPILSPLPLFLIYCIKLVQTLWVAPFLSGRCYNYKGLTACFHGWSMSICQERKMVTHAASCRAVGDSFNPLAGESLGGWSDLADKIISCIGCLQCQRLGIPLPSPLASTFRGAPCRCGEGMLHCGCTVSLQSPSLTVLSDFRYFFCSLLLFFVFLLFVFVFFVCECILLYLNAFSFVFLVFQTILL